MDADIRQYVKVYRLVKAWTDAARQAAIEARRLKAVTARHRAMIEHHYDMSQHHQRMDEELGVRSVKEPHLLNYAIQHGRAAEAHIQALNRHEDAHDIHMNIGALRRVEGKYDKPPKPTLVPSDSPATMPMVHPKDLKDAHSMSALAYHHSELANRTTDFAYRNLIKKPPRIPRVTGSSWQAQLARGAGVAARELLTRLTRKGAKWQAGGT